MWHLAAGTSQPGQVHTKCSRIAANRWGSVANRRRTFTNPVTNGMTGESSVVPVTAAHPVSAIFSSTTSQMFTWAPSVVVGATPEKWTR